MGAFGRLDVQDGASIVIVGKTDDNTRWWKETVELIRLVQRMSYVLFNALDIDCDWARSLRINNLKCYLLGNPISELLQTSYSWFPAVVLN